jgi:hypothetical protein
MGQVLIDVVIEGTTPLLCNKFGDSFGMDLPNGTFKGDKGTPLEQATAKLYIGHEKKPIIPQPNVFRCIIDAGKFFKMGKSTVTTQKTSLIPACVAIEGIELPLEHKEQWQVDTRAVRIPSTGGRILCHRPSFHDWRIGFTLDVDTDMITVKMVREILDAAGKRIGLGDFRPACKGPFGKFVVVEWKEQSQKVAA